MATFIQSILSEFSAEGHNESVMVANGNAQAPAMAYHLHVPRIELTVKGTLQHAAAERRGPHREI
jgi:hypothetical protein